MRLFALLLPLFALVPLTAAQDGAGEKPQAEIVVSNDWEMILKIYKLSQGGEDRFEAVRTLSFDYTPSLFAQDGEEVKSVSQHVDILFRPDLDEQEQRTVRLETELMVKDEETGEDVPTKVVSIVTGDQAKVWVEAADGTMTRSSAIELESTAAFHATALLSHLDLILWPDSPDIRCSFGGVLKRDGKQYATVEAEFKPGRKVPEPARLYFNGATSLIDRIDVFDPKLHMRMGTVHVEGYADHGGVKVPSLFRQLNRKGEPIGNWYLEDMSLNGEFEREYWAKP
ncbi:MAG: hypothetical protein P1V81_13610 [Planctomycetota bacterium]|nr:hypothetical protein [Planctomycetota bacterium]